MSAQITEEPKYTEPEDGCVGKYITFVLGKEEYGIEI